MLCDCKTQPMHSTFLTVLAACVLATRSASGQSAADSVAKHGARYQLIERSLVSYNHATADMDSLGLERQSTDGGSLHAYCDGTTIRLLVADYYGETVDGTLRFYFDHDSLFFVFVQIRRGHPNGKDAYPKRTMIERERFYFT